MSRFDLKERLVTWAESQESAMKSIKELYAGNAAIISGIVKLVEDAGGNVDFEKLKAQLDKNNTNESLTLTRGQLRRIVKEEINKLYRN